MVGRAPTPTNESKELLMFNRILYVSSNSDTETLALASTLRLATSLKATLEVQFFEPELPASLKKYQKTLHTGIQTRAQTLLGRAIEQAQVKHDQLSLTQSFSQSPRMTECIAEKVSRKHFDLVVKEKTLQQPLFDYFSMDLSLAKKCPCSLLWLRPDQSLPAQPKRLAVAIEVKEEMGSEFTNSTSAYLSQTAAALAGVWHSRVTWLTCYSDALINMLNTFSHGDIADNDRQRWLQDVNESNERALQKLANLANFSAPDTVQILGNPEDAIVNYALEKKIDLLLLGASNKPALTNWILGSTSEEILRNMPCATLLLKPIL
jgi:universal stress protein E